MDLKAEIENLPEFQELLDRCGTELNRAMWHGTRRSLASYRSKFLDKASSSSGVRRGPKRNPAGTPHPKRPLGSKFRWTVHPANPKNRRDSLHITSESKVKGELYTFSKASDYLENPQTIRPKRKYLAIPMMRAGHPNTSKLRAGERRPRAKPNWMSPETAIQKNPHYEFWLVDKGSYQLMWARRIYKQKKRDKASKPFIAFVYTPKVNMSKSFLEFYSGFDDYRPEIVDRFFDELDKGLDRAWRV